MYDGVKVRLGSDSQILNTETIKMGTRPKEYLISLTATFILVGRRRLKFRAVSNQINICETMGKWFDPLLLRAGSHEIYSRPNTCSSRVCNSFYSQKIRS